MNIVPVVSCVVLEVDFDLDGAFRKDELLSNECTMLMDGMITL